MSKVLFISDTHYHNFAQYSQISGAGVNTRLIETIKATMFAAKTLRGHGGKVIIHTGDTFHVRGNLSPSVLNPVVALYKALIKEGFEIHMLAGNHDLETENSTDTGASILALREVGVNVITKPTVVNTANCNFHMIPWVNKHAELVKVIESLSNKADKWSRDYNVLCLHAPLNGVIKSIPDHGFNPEFFEDLSFDAAFFGHYHNHKIFPYSASGQAVSVGALTHQSWSDVDNLAGFCILDTATMEIQHFETQAPKFIKVLDCDLETLDEKLVGENFVKVVEGTYEDMLDIQGVKDKLILMGAKYVSVEGFKRKPSASRAATASTGAPTLDGILSDYMKRTYPGQTQAEILAMDYLKRAVDNG